MSSSNCPNCGQPVSADDRFCSNCGARLEPAAGSGQPGEGDFDATSGSTSQAPVIPTLGRKNAWEYERDNVRSSTVDDDEWRMSDPGPLPPRRRRTWLWIVIGLLALLVLACCIFMYWIGYTDAGQEWFEGIATEAAVIVDATGQAATPES
jgi:hypothetical protein